MGFRKTGRGKGREKWGEEIGGADLLEKGTKRASVSSPNNSPRLADPEGKYLSS